MTQKIGIGVEAQLDTSSVEQQINAFGQRVAQANKVQYSPVSIKSLDDLETARKRFEQLLRVHGELNRLVKATNQQGQSPWGLDFESMFPGERSRANNMRAVFEQVFGKQFSDIQAPAPRPNNPPPRPGTGGPGAPGGSGGSGGPGGSGGSGGGNGGPSWGSMGVGAAQAGLRAMGPAGGVAAGSIGTGMSAGFGAGLMGLMGGMLALGVGKVVGSVVEKINQAEDNSVALDRLKRSLGDVNVSFNALKSVVHDGADSLRITYTEASQLAQQFTKLGNVSADQTKDLASELGLGVGMSRAFGLDPSQGVGVLGQMRGIGVTRNTQESRRFALLIGETIGKSGAFAKADEVMDAIAGYAAMQTRAGVGGANVGGYAGMFSSLVGSGLAGLDPSGAGALLSRVNTSLASGGAKGEASQFLTAIVGQRMGLDPLQTQVLREGGMFSTMSSSFGAGSSYARYMGGSGPSGDKTFFEGTMEAINSMPQYANNPLLKAMAVANHTGVNMRQAMALMSVKPGQMGGMMDVLQASGIDMNNMRADGIAGVSKALYGTGDDRRALANSLAAGKGDRAMSAGDLEALDKTMASGSEDEQKRLLAAMAAKYGQESTQGQDIRDSKNSLDNIKTNLADKLVPYVNEMRHGIMFMAGHSGKMSSSEIMSRMINADADARISQIKAEYKGKIDTKEDEWRTARSEGMRTNDPALMARADEVEKELEALKKEQSDKIKKENVARDASIAGIEESTKARLELAVQEREEADRRKELLGSGSSASRYGATPVKGGRGNINPPLVGSVPASVSGGGKAAEPSEYDHLFEKYGKEYGVPPALLKAIAVKESGLRPGVVSQPNNNGTRDYGLMQHNSRYLSSRGLSEDWSNPERSIEEAAKLLASNIKRGGSLRTGVRMYNGSGPRAEAYADDVLSRMGATKIDPQAVASAGSGNAANGLRISADPITVNVVGKDGMPTQAPQAIQLRVPAPSPFGLKMN